MRTSRKPPKRPHPKRDKVRTALLAMCRAGRPWPRARVLLTRLDCSFDTPGKAIAAEPELKRWQAEGNVCGRRPGEADFRDIRAQLVRMCEERRAFRTHRALCCELGCSLATLRKAIAGVQLLMIWSGKAPPLPGSASAPTGGASKQSRPAGLICPRCRSANLRMIAGWRLTGGYSRRRQCADCGFRVSTLEAIRENRSFGKRPPYQGSRSQVGLRRGRPGASRHAPTAARPADLITTKIASKDYSVSRRTLIRYVQEKTLTDYRRAGAGKTASCLFSRAELERYFDRAG